MKFICEKALLNPAAQTAARAASAKSAQAALEGILIKAEDGAITLTGFNLETGIRCAVPAEVREPGAVVVPARLFSDMTRRLSDGLVTFEASEAGTVKIDCGKSHFSVVGAPADEYPILPAPQRDKVIRLSSLALKDGLGLTLFAVSDNENKQVHTGLLFDAEPGAVTLVGVDGYRMAIHRAEAETGIDEGISPYSFVVPGAAMREVERILEHSEDVTADIAAGKGFVCFTVGDVTLTARLLEGKFLNYKETVPQDFEATFEASSGPLRDALERVSLMINEKVKSPIRCVFDDGLLQMSCVSTMGQAEDECVLDGTIGEPLEIGFNNRYLLDALRAGGTDRIRLSVKNSLSALLIGPAEGNRFTFMVLPIRLKA